jgi:hypothetical protein
VFVDFGLVQSRLMKAGLGKRVKFQFACKKKISETSSADNSMRGPMPPERRNARSVTAGFDFAATG